LNAPGIRKIKSINLSYFPAIADKTKGKFISEESGPNQLNDLTQRIFHLE
jgi:hypothetical protein